MPETTFPKPYAARQTPSLPGGDALYLRKELTAIQDTLNGVLEMLPQPATTAPGTPREGMQRLSKAPWRPVAGQTTDRWVSFVNGAWAYLN